MNLQTIRRAAIAVYLFSAVSLFAQPEAGDPVEIGFTFSGWALIDGIVDRVWEDVPSYPIANVFSDGRDGTEDPDNASGWWTSMFDDESLYLLVFVKDDLLVASVDGSLESADAVEVFLSGSYTRTFAPAWNVPVFDFNDYHIIFGIGEAVGAAPRISAGPRSTPFWVPEGGVAETGGVKYACVAVDGGYLMEIQIALELLYDEAAFDFRDWPLLPYWQDWFNEGNFNDYRKIGFEIGVTRNDSGVEPADERHFWASHEDIYPGGPGTGNNLGTAWLHPGTWGTLVFIDRDIFNRKEYYNDPLLHWLYYFGGGWALWYANDFSSDWGYLYLGDYHMRGVAGWKYHLSRGWIYFVPGSVQREVFVYSPELGWLVASEAYGDGQYYRYETDSFEKWVR